MPRCRLPVWLVALPFLWLIAPALAGNGPVFSLPQAGVKNKSGLIVSFDGRGVEGNGYRPVKVTVSPWPPKPLTADRQIRLVIKPLSYNTSQAPEVTQVIDLPEGSMSVETTISVPQGGLWHSMQIWTYEGGEKLKDLSPDYINWATGYWDWTEDRPAMLFIDPAVPLQRMHDSLVQPYRSTFTDNTPTYDLPNIRTLIDLFPDPNRAGNMPAAAASAGSAKQSDTMLLAQLVDWGRVEMLPPAELPERWIDLSQYDVITISVGDLQTLAAKQPKHFAALREWVSTGPLLNVYGVGSQFERLADLEKLLSLPPLPVAADAAANHRGWSAPGANVKTSELLSAWEEADYVVQSFPGGGYSKRPKPATKPTTPQSPSATKAGAAANKTPPLLYRRAGMGCVAALAAENPFPGQRADWILLFNTIPDSHWKWFRREGFSLHRKNRDYWTFLIPDVGEAPVVSFLLLVTLFAVVIGPVSYILLGRSRRLYLLLLTVPTGAFLVTLSLVTYALLTDGLSMRLRSRSFTALDQRTGEAAVWARHSYYAALSPSKGLVFPEDTTVFPIESEPEGNRGNPNATTGKLKWDEGQHLTSGYLTSRTATQFMLQRATKTTAKLAVSEGKSAGQPPVVENHLESVIRYLLLRDSRGDYYTAGSSNAWERDPTSRLTMTKADPAAAEKELKKLADAVEPDLPRGYDPEVHNNNVMSFLLPNYGYWGNIDASATRPLMAASVLERNLAECVLPTKSPLDPGTYCAIVETSPTVPTGVSRVRQEASLHVIRGRY